MWGKENTTEKRALITVKILLKSIFTKENGTIYFTKRWAHLRAPVCTETHIVPLEEEILN